MCIKHFRTLRKITKKQSIRSITIESADGNVLTEEAEIREGWTEYCSALYNHPIAPNVNVLEQPTVNERSDLPILREEVKNAIIKLKAGKSPGVDNIPAELIKAGGEAMIDFYFRVCCDIWSQGVWPKHWSQSVFIPIPKTGNIKACKNYRTIILICHASKIMLKILQERIKQKAEDFIAEEQAGFRAGRSTAEHIFNVNLLIQKHLDHQRTIHHNFIDFKKAFDRVWWSGLWWALRGANIDESIIGIIQALYEQSTGSVMYGGALGEDFNITVGVRQGCLLSPVLFNIFLEIIMRSTLEDYQSSISCGGRQLSNLRFADDIDLITGSEHQLQDLTERLVRASSHFGMEISIEKSKLLVNGRLHGPAYIRVGDDVLEEVHKFKYLGAVIARDGASSMEIKRRLSMATSVATSLTRVWRTVNVKTKIRLYRTLVIPVLLYASETWTIKADEQRKLEAFENKCFRRMLRVSYVEHRTNASIREEIEHHVGAQEPLMSLVKKKKLKWFGHVTRHDSISRDILQGTVEGRRPRGKSRKCWMDNIREWTGLTIRQLIDMANDR